MWSDLSGWMSQTQTAISTNQYKTPSDQSRASSIDLEWASSVVASCQAHFTSPSRSSPPSLAFCHNDLLAGNVMREVATGRIQLIDFEYGGKNYTCFDIANHFNEWAGGTDDSNPKYSQLPTPGEKRVFVEAYVSKMYELDELGSKAGAVGGPAWCDEVETLLVDVEVFMLINHVYWSFWGACLAATEGCGEFDYLNYCGNRQKQAKVIEEEARRNMTGK